MSIYCNNIMYEGVHGSGKTTLIMKEFKIQIQRDSLGNGAKILYKHDYLPSKDCNRYEHYMTHLKFIKICSPYVNHLFDRGVISEIIYTQLLNREIQVNENLFYTILDEYKRKEIQINIIIIKFKKDRQLFYKYKKEKNNWCSYEQFELCNKLYLELAKKLIKKYNNINIIYQTFNKELHEINSK